MQLTHQLRACHAGILVGVNTVIVDNPSLTVRFGVTGSNPLPVVLDSSLRIPMNCKLLQSGECVRPIIATVHIEDSNHQKKQKAKDLESAGARLIYCKSSNTGHVDIVDLLGQLIKHNINSLMVEGGASVVQNFLECKQHIIDTVIITISPMFVGGVKAVSNLLPIGQTSKYQLSNLRYQVLGIDMVVQGDFSITNKTD